MKKNYEIKYELRDGNELKRIISFLRDYTHSSEKQIDIYYKVKSGRLKLRIINDIEGSLILYNRNETKSKRVSNYVISRTGDYNDLDLILRKQFEVLITVEKLRSIYVNKNVRVHIDSVNGLGKFLEIEIIYDNFLKATKQMSALISLLGLDENRFIRKSYSDLIIKRK